MTVEELIASLRLLPNQKAQVLAWDVDTQDWVPLEAWVTNLEHDIVHLCTRPIDDDGAPLVRLEDYR